MYDRMRLKGIAIVLALAAVAPLFGLEEALLLLPGQGPRPIPAPGTSFPGSQAPAAASVSVRDPILGAWLPDNVVTAPGWRGGLDYVLAPGAYRVDDSTDLLLHFDANPVRDEASHWTIDPGQGVRIETTAAIGPGSASFTRPGSGVRLQPGRQALLNPGSRFRDFSIEFWLYPTSVENGQAILSWQSTLGQSGAIRSQSLACTVAGARLSWNFQGFFDLPGQSKAAQAQASRVEIRGRKPLLPRTWSQHLLRFDGDTGLLEYLVDGQTEATAYLTTTGREGGTVYAPVIGSLAPLVLGEDYRGFIDELRLSRSFVEKPALAAYGRDPGLLLSPLADLGYGHSRLLRIEVQAKTPGATGLELSYRISDEWVGWDLERPEWIPLRAGEALPESARGRYVQVRAEFFPDGTGGVSPSLSALTLHYEADPPPPPPARVIAIPKDGAIQVSWSRVVDSDVAGYLVYYGTSPGNYFGSTAREGGSPVDVGNVLSYTLSGLPNGGLLYLVIAAYDRAAAPGNPATRAGEFSGEVTARPSRTAP